jgi:hypothetical protein
MQQAISTRSTLSRPTFLTAVRYPPYTLFVTEFYHRFLCKRTFLFLIQKIHKHGEYECLRYNTEETRKSVEELPRNIFQAYTKKTIADFLYLLVDDGDTRDVLIFLHAIIYYTFIEVITSNCKLRSSRGKNLFFNEHISLVPRNFAK